MAQKSVLGSIVRFVAFALALLIGILGVLMVFAGISFISDYDGTALPVITIGVILVAAAVGIVYLAVQRRASESAPYGGAPYGAPAGYPGPSETIDTPPVIPTQVATPAQPSQPPAKASFDRLVLRSTDVIATLKDVAGHDRASHSLLSDMLGRVGITSWDDAPKMDAAKLRRNNRFWLNANIGDLDADGVNKILAAEAALNIEQDVIDLMLAPNEQGIAAVLARTADLDVEYSEAIGQVNIETFTSPTDGEWNCRLRIADFLENAPAAFRITYDMQVNLREGLAEIAVDVPRPQSLAVLTADPARQVVAARAYALRVALLAARGAFKASKRIKRVTVHCNEPDIQGEPATLMRITATPETFKGLLAASRNPSIDINGFPRDEDIQASFDSVGWFAPICTWEGFTTPELDLPGRFDPVEAMDAQCPDFLAAATGARTYRDLGINESGVRTAAWRKVRDTLGDSTGSAVSALVALRNTARDLTVVEAADRTSKALVDGSIDVIDREGMAELFINGSSLDRATKRAQKSLQDDLNPDQAAEVLAQLEEALAPITETGMYLDDSDCVYRYFNSVGERYAYNRAFADDPRTVKLVPDSYYMAHSIAARLCSSLDKVDVSLAHADELIRMAPMTTDAALVKVRILEDATRVYEAADLLKEYIEKSSTLRDMAVCLYRLAYMEWKLGRSDLAVACYQRSIRLFPPNAAQAEEELDDLLRGDDTLKRIESDEEVCKVLANADIPRGSTGNLLAKSLTAAIACVDANVFSVARPMLGITIDANRDDALTDVHRSLKPLA